MITVNYANPIPYTGNRPFADVELRGPVAVVTLKCLVDTGADYFQINENDATAAGISLAGATASSVSTVAGTAVLQLVKGVDVTIEGSKVLTVDVLVDPTNSTKPQLAGRNLLWAAFDFGFNLTDWLRT